ncbi:spore coat protein CotH [Paenibacillus shirakamiensis]|uniref:Spore coat protein CotH n=1 Tax=Paenibacillus shirakamiensis TaxID=1265935 RepID=A0ABS4JKJ9_9BACL|nr:CotH kinase family protein [Paenibacillus shirakamiensis]MBP2001506.1 spore coat protein CotH [Paenibacillus shirakamiensis]
MLNVVFKKMAVASLAAVMVLSSGSFIGSRNVAHAESEVTPSYTTIFQKDKIIKVNVTIADADWKGMLASPLDKAYKKVTVDVDGHVLNNVGFSTKGNLTLTSVAAMKDSDRYSFRLKFDKYDKTQSLLGLDKMVLNNSYTDPSYMREYLHYEALRAIGMDAPLTAFTNLYINGKLYGFYLGVESVADSYLKRNYGENAATDGVLYDTEEQSYLQYKEGSEYESITYETGKKDNKASLKTFIKTLNAMPAGEKGDIESVLDVDSALKYIASNAVLGNYDSYNGDKGHNFLLYGNASGKFTVVPWDFNMSYNGYSGGGGPGGERPGATDAGKLKDTTSTTTSAKSTVPTTTKGAEGGTSTAATTAGTNTSAITASIDNPTLGINIDKVPMINNLLKVPAYKAKYLSYVSELVKQLKTTPARITGLAQLIRPFVQNDPTKFYTLEQFDSNIKYSTLPDASGGGMQGGGTPPGGFTPPAGMEGMKPPEGSTPAAPPTGDMNGTQPTPPTGGQAPGQGMGMMASGSIMTFVYNRLVNLQGQLGLPLTSLPATEDSTESGQGSSKGIAVQLNGKRLAINGQQPVMRKGTVLVPARSILQSFGATVNWNASSKKVTVKKDQNTLVLTLGSRAATINGQTFTLSASAEIVGGSTLVPVRFIAEALSMKVYWTNESQTVYISSK